MRTPSKHPASARLRGDWRTRLRDGGWSHEEYLAAVLSREVAAREASGAATASAQRDSRPGNRWKTSTLTTNPHSVVTSSHTWEPEPS